MIHRNLHSRKKRPLQRGSLPDKPEQTEKKLAGSPSREDASF
jgi:hypothetical protein